MERKVDKANFTRHAHFKSWCAVCFNLFQTLPADELFSRYNATGFRDRVPQGLPDMFYVANDRDWKWYSKGCDFSTMSLNDILLGMEESIRSALVG